MEKKTIVIVGAGAGLGKHIGKVFGEHGFRVVLMARREDKLREYTEELRGQNIETDYQVVDCADMDSIRSAFRAVKEKYGAIDVLEYNTAVLSGGQASEIAPEELVERYKVDIAGAVCAVQQVLPEQMGKGAGTILFTGGGLALAPSPAVISISIHKAALRAYAIALHEELKAHGIYVGIVNIKGQIGSDDYYATDRVAGLFYRMYRDRREPELTH